jgi:hypothetical protein
MQPNSHLSRIEATPLIASSTVIVPGLPTFGGTAVAL